MTLHSCALKAACIDRKQLIAGVCAFSRMLTRKHVCLQRHCIACSVRVGGSPARIAAAWLHPYKMPVDISAHIYSRLVNTGSGPAAYMLCTSGT